MPAVHCRLICASASDYLRQLYTGFGLLARRGVVEVEIERGVQHSNRRSRKHRLNVVLNGEILICYDTCDPPQVYEDDASACDLYFKRSYDPTVIDQRSDRHRVRPLGFNYPVYGPRDAGLRRSCWLLREPKAWRESDAWRQLLRSLPVLSRLERSDGGRAASSVGHFEDLPKLYPDASVIFFARTWDPDGGVRRRPDRIEERERINAMRAACIRALRREFGRTFVGGLAPTPHARANYPDCVVRDEIIRKPAYVREMRRCAIGVATMGLFRTNGFKIAEYVAASKAIVAERMYHMVPGEFLPGVNYLEFATASDCVNAVTILREDPARRLAMMKANHDYYNAFLRPDMLVLNTLAQALELRARSAAVSRSPSCDRLATRCGGIGGVSQPAVTGSG
jgi:hypothetical protein